MKNMEFCDTVHQAVMGLLEGPPACWDPDTRLPSGYVTAIHTMIDKMRARGVQVFSS